MTPLDFIKFSGDSTPNMPVYKWSDALEQDIRIVSQHGSLEVLSYYYHLEKKCMVLEVGEPL
jgi:hypothetical protein